MIREKADFDIDRILEIEQQKLVMIWWPSHVRFLKRLVKNTVGPMVDFYRRGGHCLRGLPLQTNNDIIRKDLENFLNIADKAKEHKDSLS